MSTSSVFLLAAFSYMAIPLSLAYRRPPLISPPVFLALFYTANYGPHTLFSDAYRMSSGLPEYVNLRYATAILVANASIGCVFLLNGRTRPKVQDPDFAPQLSKRPNLWTTGAHPRGWVVGLSLLVLSLDAPSFARTTSNLVYFFSSAEVDYYTLRREAFVGAPIEAVQGYLRNGIGPLLACIVAIRYTRVSSAAAKARAGGIILLIYVSMILSVSKFPTIFLALTLALCLHVNRHGVRVHAGKTLLWGGAVGIFAFALLGALYRLQYSSALGAAQLTEADIQSVMLYRPFFGQSDALRFWFYEWPEHQSWLGLRGINRVAELFGATSYNASLELPVRYMGHSRTSWQTGFIGDGWAIGGIWGVALLSAFAAQVSSWAWGVTARLATREGYAATVAVSSMTMYFLCSRSITAALISGSVLYVPLLGTLVDRERVPSLRNLKRKAAARRSVDLLPLRQDQKQ